MITANQKEKKVYYIADKKHKDLIIIDEEHKTISIKPNTEYYLYHS